MHAMTARFTYTNVSLRSIVIVLLVVAFVETYVLCSNLVELKRWSTELKAVPQ